MRLPEPSATVAAAGLRFARISREGAVLAFGDAYRVTLVTAIVALGWDGWDVLAPRLSFGKVLELLRYRKSA